MAIRRGSKVNSAFSSASMTDLMFLLLVFMLIATTLINPNALKLTLPTSNNQIKEKPYTTVSITSDLQYYVETVPVRFDDLETILRGKLEGAEQPTLSLHADKSVPIDNVVKVMNIAKDNKCRSGRSTNVPPKASSSTSATTATGAVHRTWHCPKPKRRPAGRIPRRKSTLRRRRNRHRSLRRAASASSRRSIPLPNRNGR